MHKNVEILIGRLSTDPRLLERFARDPQGVLREMRLELTDVELRALAGLDPSAFRAFRAALDPRLCRASLTADGRPGHGSTTTESDRDSSKETQR